MTRSARYATVVTVGTTPTPFGRLIRWCERHLDGQAASPLLIQHGPAKDFAQSLGNAAYVDYLPYEQLKEAMASADLIISHAGSLTSYM